VSDAAIFAGHLTMPMLLRFGSARGSASTAGARTTPRPSSAGRETPLLCHLRSGPACGDWMKQRAAVAVFRETCRFAAALLLGSVLTGCFSDSAPTGSVSQCVAQNFPSYNPKDKDQCIAACIKCEKGVTTTCATACSLKGTR
jgi:hypothetical protein